MNLNVGIDFDSCEMCIFVCCTHVSLYSVAAGLYVILRPPKKPKHGQPVEMPQIPAHLRHLVVRRDKWDETCPWSLSGPQFPNATAIQQRYCYPKGVPQYSNRVGGALWTIFFDGRDKEDLEFRLLHVYLTAKRGVVSQPKKPPQRRPIYSREPHHHQMAPESVAMMQQVNDLPPRHSAAGFAVRYPTRRRGRETSVDEIDTPKQPRLFPTKSKDDRNVMQKQTASDTIRRLPKYPTSKDEDDEEHNEKGEDDNDEEYKPMESNEKGDNGEGNHQLNHEVISIDDDEEPTPEDAPSSTPDDAPSSSPDDAPSLEPDDAPAPPSWKDRLSVLEDEFGFEDHIGTIFSRLSRLENHGYGGVCTNMSINARLAQLEKTLRGPEQEMDTYVVRTHL